MEKRKSGAVNGRAAEDPSLLWDFAVETTAHGVAKIAKAKSKPRRMLWCVAFLGASLVSILMISLRCKAYFEYNTVVQFDKQFHDKLEYPAVTICNFNKLRLSYREGGTQAKAVALFSDMMSSLYTGNETIDTCGQCNRNQFKCLMDLQTCCIPMDWKCDHYVDCIDGSDENTTACLDVFLAEDFYELPHIPQDSVVDICDHERDTPLSDTNGWISSSNFTVDQYPENLDCRVRIRTNTGSTRYLIAKIWALIEEDYYGCRHDRLVINSISICGLYEGSVAVAADGDHVEVEFVSDSSVTDAGFALQWRLSDNDEGLPLLTNALIGNTYDADYDDDENSGDVEEYDGSEYGDDYDDDYDDVNSQLPQVVDGVVSVCTDSDPMIAISINGSVTPLTVISHRGYLNHTLYPTNSNCLRMFVSGTQSLQLTLYEIGIESEYPHCLSDSLTIDIGDSSERFCGYDVIPMNFTVPPHTAFTARFISGSSSQGVGFIFVIRAWAGNESNDDDSDDWDDDDDFEYSGDSEPEDAGEEIQRRRRSSGVFNVFDLIRKRRESTTTNSTKKTSTQVNVDLSDTKFSELISSGGWQLTTSMGNYSGNSNDSMTLLRCSFRGVECNSSWFQHTFTKFGNCYTFNALDWLTPEMVQPLTTPLQQIQSGPAHGLDIMVDIQRYEYSEQLGTGHRQVGLKFQVHSSDELPDVENHGAAIGSGQHGYVGFKMTRVVNIEPPWGTCNKSLKLQYSNHYSYVQCAAECKLSYVEEECGCKPFYFPGPARECTATELKNCALSAIARIDLGEFAQKCYCPTGCDYYDVETQISYTNFADTDSIVSELNSQLYNLTNGTYPRGNRNFYKNNVVSMNIYFDELSFNVLKQLKAMDESSLLSDLGGQLGLFIGVSVLTICEMFETLFLSITKCMGRRRNLRKIAHNWAEKTNQKNQNINQWQEKYDA